MYEPLRASLMAIWSEMSRASQRYPALYHQRFSDPMLVGPGLISEEAFAAFQGMFPDKEWASWERTPDGSYWGRFHGKKDGLDEFERLAESAYLVLHEFNSELPEGHGFHGWLNVIHDMARDFPTPLLRTRYGVWGIDPQPTGDKFDEVVNLWENSATARFRPHPFFNELVHNVFTSSMSAIELILAPEKALLVGEWLDDFPVILYRFEDEPSSEPELDGSQRHHPASDVQDQSDKGSKRLVEEKITRPIVEMAFDGATWQFRYEFAGIKESGPITTDMKGFTMYQAILKHDGDERWSSEEFEREAGLGRPKVFYLNTGTVDADAESRKAVFDSEGDGEPIVLQGASTDQIIDDKDRRQLLNDIESLQKELETCQNLERSEEIEQQLERLIARRSRSVNIRGKSRTVNCTEEEKARKRVTNRLSAARNMLMKSMPTLAQYLLMTVKNDNGWSYTSSRALALLAQK